MRDAIDMALAQPAQKYLTCIRALTDQCAALIWERDELQKQVWRYEKHGVTCQTYGHKIDSSCSECNVHENYTAPPAAQPEQGEKFCDANCVWTDHHPDCEHAQPATEEKKINYQMLHDFAMEKKIDYTELFVMVQNATGIHPAPFAR
jgi:hypothetical protein